MMVLAKRRRIISCEVKPIKHSWCLVSRVADAWTRRSIAYCPSMENQDFAIWRDLSVRLCARLQDEQTLLVEWTGDHLAE
jgi:hypothetical protein